MAAAEVDSKMDTKDKVQAPEQEHILNIMTYSQRGRMDEQRCVLNPGKAAQSSATPKGSSNEDFFHTLANVQGQRLDDQRVTLTSLPGFNHQKPKSGTFHGSTPLISVTECTPDTYRKFLSGTTNRVEGPPQRDLSRSTQLESTEEQKKLINIISHGQRGRMDDQSCSLEPSKSTPCTPNLSNQQPDANALNKDSEEMFNLLANTQGHRLDDQRVSLPSLPGIKNENPTSSPGNDSGYLCYMVSKVQGSRMEDQRCSLPQILRPEAEDRPGSGSGPPRSASFSPGSDIERPKSKDKTSKTEELSNAEQESFLSMMHHSQRGRMEEQRCALKSPLSSPKHSEHKHPRSSVPTGPDSEKFFNLLANSQGRRLDDQRVSLQSLPGIKNGAIMSTAAETNASYLCYMVSKAQGSRMDEQRCSAPQILQNLGSPSAQRKPRPSSEQPSVACSSDNPFQRSASLNRAKTDQPPPEASQAEQEQFLKMMRHAQRGRMDEQRCSLQPSRSTPASPTHNGNALNKGHAGADVDAFFKIIASSQAQRLDNQRVALPVLPGISGNAGRKENGSSANAGVQAAAPHITLTEATPKTSNKAISPSASQYQMAHAECSTPKTLPKSASFSLGTEHGKQNSPGQVTLKVSMSFTPQQGRRNDGQPCTFPEVFLTLGAPGDNFVVPLSPIPGRPVSLNLNLVPKEGIDSWHCSSGGATPKKGRSRPTSPNPGACSRTQVVTSHPPEQGQRATSPISPDMDYFSLIERVHASQLQMAQGEHKAKCDPGKGKEKAEQRKGKKAGKKDKKNGGNKR